MKTSCSWNRDVDVGTFPPRLFSTKDLSEAFGYLDKAIAIFSEKNSQRKELRSQQDDNEWIKLLQGAIEKKNKTAVQQSLDNFF